MPRKRLTRTESQAETRLRLIEAAATLFEAQGFHRTSLADIAAEAGFTTGAVYSNFARKEDIALAVLTEDTAAGWLDLLAMVGEKPTIEQVIGAVIDWRVRALAHHSALATLRIELSLPSLHNEDLQGAIVGAQQSLRIVLAQYLEQLASDNGSKLRVRSSTLSASILGIFDGTAIAAGVEPSSPHHEAFAFSLASMVYGSFDPSPITPEDWPRVLRRLAAKARRLGPVTTSR